MAGVHYLKVVCNFLDTFLQLEDRSMVGAMIFSIKTLCIKDIQYKDIQYNGILYKDTQYNDIQYKDTQHTTLSTKSLFVTHTLNDTWDNNTRIVC